ncbi:hypothetical protein VNO78_02906 [Psophocarpus tetragonolobus]|uniref:Uncharacterized protein n=1 Tax=Psophocarpus tetragonolobus TaxID=3891 RepID=A0AAN9T0L7_PSOTE
MAVPATSSAAVLGPIPTNRPFSSPFRSLPTSSTRQPLTVFAMAPKKKVNKYDDNWKKEWFGAGIFYEGSEEVKVDVFKKLEKRKVLSNVEKAGLLSKAEDLGFTLSSIEKLGVFSKAEQLGLLSLLDRAAAFSPSALASASLPALVAAILALVLIPDDSAALVAVQFVLAAALGFGAVGLFLGSVVLGGLQEAD